MDYAFISELTIWELIKLIKELRTYPEDKQHLDFALLELKKRHKKLTEGIHGVSNKKSG